MKYIIAGGRDFHDIKVMEDTLKNFTDITEVISGAAKGADTLGTNWAGLHNIPVRLFLPNWDQYGKAAGFIRNAEMAEEADALIAFWDGKSKGTAHMIKTMKIKKKPYYVFDYSGKEITI